ncbi:MAG TPA: MFS transporter [Acidimicrobiales bacterium]
MALRDASPLHLSDWKSKSVIGVALVALCAGFGQFGAVAALGNVAKGFGHVVSGTTIADQAGLSGTTIGIGLGVLRLASLVAMPLTAIADRIGRRRVLLGCCAIGLVATVGASASPSFWWFVAIFAVGRPLLSASTAVGSVVVAEITDAPNRARGVALVTAGFGAGSGLVALLHGAASGFFGFRGLFLLAVIPLAFMPFIGRLVSETGRFEVAKARFATAPPMLGTGHRRLLGRLVVVAMISFGVAETSGPATGFVYLDAQDITKLASGVVSAMVLTAALTGIVGLYLGQLLADRLGRRLTGIVAMIGLALASMVTYSGGRSELFVGYSCGIFFTALLAPTAGSFVNELFPTEVRAHVAGWLVISSVLGAIAGLVGFGAIADAGGSLRVAAIVVFAPTIVISWLFLALPETKGLEPEAVPSPE